ncbi:winged helix-turn-helix domain-containing protein [uncultured Arthrobacter sp.]|uniref:winged helix-turn-helix domain-containing protein n=1 Tax=uncultured Arthrobacter sp. TaxID=114050 RepID=UPI00260D5E5E|nr:winged helix-turn-helix domain-containing protein [uncultured Arthrobacter sp.]
MLHDADGTVRTLCLDLDTSKARKIVVDDDARRLGDLLRAAGIAYVEDESPSGGRHLYVPLQEPLIASEARQLVEALGQRAASLDPSPHQNVVHGCIRVPGSAHKAGGHQSLITPLTEAYGILTRRNPATAVAALRKALAPELYRAEQDRRRAQARAAAATSAARPGAGHERAPMGREDSPLRVVARTGVYDTTRYTSDSEARMAVLNHLAACQWSVDQVRTSITGCAGTQAAHTGLAALYGAKADRLLPIEWAKAQAFTGTGTGNTSAAVKSPSQRAGVRKAHNYNTSPTSLTGGSPKADPASSQQSIHQLVNDLENILYAVLDHRLQTLGRVSISLRFLIRAVFAYMRTNQTTLLDVGCRSFAVALGKDHVTIARLLPMLEAASAGILTRVDRGRGRTADTYAIQLPAEFESLARELTWRKGKIHAIRPVFRVLGDVAALTYEAIERGRRSPTTADLVRSTGISRRALTDHLARMEALGMIRRHRDRWQIVATTNLAHLADRLGATADRQAQINRYRRQRAAWHAWLDRHLTPQLDEHELYDPEVDEYWLPPLEHEHELQHSLWHPARTAA